MRQLFVLCLSLLFMPMAHATDAAQIKIKVNGAIHDNRYFLCMTGVGCLSMLAAKKGKIYPILKDIEMRRLYVMDTSNHMRLNPQGLPSSCQVTVKPNQTITITGRLTKSATHSVELDQLHCAIH